MTKLKRFLIELETRPDYESFHVMAKNMVRARQIAERKIDKDPIYWDFHVVSIKPMTEDNNE